jgi:hypothetical protein
MDLMYCEANASNLSNARGYNSTYKKIVIKKGGSIQDACYGMTIHWDVSRDYEGMVVRHTRTETSSTRAMANTESIAVG